MFFLLQRTNELGMTFLRIIDRYKYMSAKDVCNDHSAYMWVVKIF